MEDREVEEKTDKQTDKQKERQTDLKWFNTIYIYRERDDI